MSLVMTSPPAAEPVTVAGLKAHLRIDTGDEDILLASYCTERGRRRSRNGAST